MVSHPSKRLLMLILLLLCVVPFSTTSAQDVIPIEYGNTVVNTLGVDGNTVAYTFNGTIGDLVTIRAVGISAGTDPTLSLVGPPEQILAINDNVFSVPFSTAAQIVFRLQASGPHFIVVSGTPGDFFLTLESRPATPLIILQLDTPVTLSFPLIEPAQSFVFNTDPIFATTLLIDATPFTVDAYVEVRDGTGQIITTLRNNLDSACISVGPGDQLLEMTIVALPEVIGTINLTLSTAPCILGAVPAEPPPQPTAEFTPVVVEGFCTASSPRNVNIRSGPGTNYARLALLQAREPIQVTGQSENGQWFVVQNQFIQGWMSASVVSVTGPCTQLAVVAAPPLPVASATPGFPVIVVQPPVVVTTTPVTLGTLPPVVITSTPVAPVPTTAPVATATLAPTVAVPTATLVPTLTLTPTATP